MIGYDSKFYSKDEFSFGKDQKCDTLCFQRVTIYRSPLNRRQRALFLKQKGDNII